VLEGVFQDEHGDYPAGWYVRNPPTSSHTPGSESGCIIFVKLWQFAPDDRAHVRMDTTKMPFLPANERAGVEVMPLFRDSSEDVRLERWAPNAEIVLDVHGGMEILGLDGDFAVEGERCVPESWIRLPPGSMLRANVGRTGCKVWIKSGHLAAHLTAS
jgi:hypothetical protein